MIPHLPDLALTLGGGFSFASIQLIPHPAAFISLVVFA